MSIYPTSKTSQFIDENNKPLTGELPVDDPRIYPPYHLTFLKSHHLPALWDYPVDCFVDVMHVDCWWEAKV
jgi:hypothetical protein